MENRRSLDEDVTLPESFKSYSPVMLSLVTKSYLGFDIAAKLFAPVLLNCFDAVLDARTLYPAWLSSAGQQR